MDTYEGVKATRIYQEHLARAQASLDRSHAKVRRRRILTFPIAVLVGAVVAYGVVRLEAPWARALLAFLHDSYVIALLVFAGIVIVNVNAARRYRGLLELQARLAALLVATNLLQGRPLTPGGRSPLEGL